MCGFVRECTRANTAVNYNGDLRTWFQTTGAYDLRLEVLTVQYHHSDNAQRCNFDSD